jgi:hypothetical protein
MQTTTRARPVLNRLAGRGKSSNPAKGRNRTAAGREIIGALTNIRMPGRTV